MANWNNPVLADPYQNFQDSLKDRDVDSATMFIADPTNPVTGMIRWNRSINAFQEWNGSAWITKIIAAAGGGTGQGTALALGTMASQNANNVSITGGNIISLSQLSCNSNITSGGYIQAGNGIIYGGGTQITDGSGRVIAIDGTRFANLSGANLTNLNGAAIASGINGAAITTGVVYRDRLGSGAVGNGTRVLMDNGTWADKNLVGGGMVEIVHQDAYYDADGKVFNIPWAGAVPSAVNKISIDLHTTYPNLTWGILNTTQFQIFGAATNTAIKYTAFHHITQV